MSRPFMTPDQLIRSHSDAICMILEQTKSSIQLLNMVLDVLFSNSIDSLSDVSLNLRELKTLNLSKNKIEEIPQSFLKGCNKLEVLEVSCNVLSKYGGCWKYMYS